MRIIPYLISALFLIISCKSSQQTSQVSKNLPELQVHPGEPQSHIYRASVTKLFDLIHTRLDVSFNYEKREMYGIANIALKPHFYSTDSLILDARGMLLHKVALRNGNHFADKPYRYTNDSLIIQLGKTVTPHDTLIVYIEYTARPDSVMSREQGRAVSDDKGLYFINPLRKDPKKPRQIWTQSEPQAASAWFPTLDAPNQKMTLEIAITADSGDVTLSNGILMSSIANKNGTHTDTWRMEGQLAPYLSMMAIGPYAVVKDKWRNKDVNYYVEPAYENVARKIFGNTPEMMEYFSKILKVDYPWSKYSQITARDYVSGAMENTTATLHSDFLQQNERQMIDQSYEDYISHELFHQWFGDYVTCESWSNTPLNESFATYGEYLWNEYKYGSEAADYGLWQDLGHYLREAETKKVNMIRFEYNLIDDMFDRHSYQKGSCILHLLRKETGDSAFFTSLHNYLEKNKFKSVEIHNLRLAFEEVTGRDLNWFFNQWFLDKGHPQLDISYGYDEISKNTSITIKQEQDTSGIRIFNLNLETDIYLNGKVERKVLNVTDRVQTFTYYTGSKPLLVNVDATKTLPCQKVDHHSTEEWIYQYDHAPLYADRLEALRSSPANYESSSPYASLMFKAAKDKFWHIRLTALNRMNVSAYDSLSLQNLLMDLAANDPKSQVRAMAISKLDERFTGNSLNSFYIKALNDSSYSVFTNAMQALAFRDSLAALEYSTKFDSNHDPEMVDIISAVYSAFGDERQSSYMIESLKFSEDDDLYPLIKNYGDYLIRQHDDKVLNDGINVLAEYGRNALQWHTRFAATQSLAELITQLRTYKTSGTVSEKEKFARLESVALEKIRSIMKDETDPTLKSIYTSSLQK